MQGIFIDGRRPTSKKQIKEQVAHYPQFVSVEATSLFGNEYDGPITDAPDGAIHFVGPDPYTSRRFYGTIEKCGDKITVR